MGLSPNFDCGRRCDNVTNKRKRSTPTSVQRTIQVPIKHVLVIEDIRPIFLRRQKIIGSAFIESKSLYSVSQKTGPLQLI